MASLASETLYGDLEIDARLPNESVNTGYEPSCLSSQTFIDALTGCSSLFSRLVDNTGKCLGYRKPKNQQGLEDQEREDRETYGSINSAHGESYDLSLFDSVDPDAESVVVSLQGDPSEESYANRRLPGEEDASKSPAEPIPEESSVALPTERMSGDTERRPSVGAPGQEGWSAG